MRICYFGDYDPSYSRTRVILRGLNESGNAVLHCNARDKNFSKYWKLFQMLRALHGEYDVLFVGQGDARLMPLFARLMTRRPVVWEPLFSIYDNWVLDRKLTSPHSPKAYLYWFMDWLGCKASNLIILDTDANCAYFHSTFHVPMKKLARVLVGADTDTFVPLPKTQETEKFEVEFHGKYTPVQGADVIVRAAKVLEEDNVHVTMIGGGQTFNETKALAGRLDVQNVSFLPFVSREDIVEHIRNADVCMGAVGDTPRVARVIPNKLYEAAAMARPSINADTSSLHEVFMPGVDTIVVQQGDHKDLARAIRELRASGLAEEIGKAAYQTFSSSATPQKIAESLLAVLRERLEIS